MKESYVTDNEFLFSPHEIILSGTPESYLLMQNKNKSKYFYWLMILCTDNRPQVWAFFQHIPNVFANHLFIIQKTKTKIYFD